MAIAARTTSSPLIEMGQARQRRRSGACGPHRARIQAIFHPLGRAGKPDHIASAPAEPLPPQVLETAQLEIMPGRADYLVELRGLCAGRSARSNRCKSDAMKE
jgi:hypothetical protein